MAVLNRGDGSQPLLVMHVVFTWSPSATPPLRKACMLAVAEAGLSELAGFPGERRDVAVVLCGLDCGAIEAMAAQIVAWATDPAQAAAMGRRARQSVDASFSLSAMVDAHSSQYQLDMASAARMDAASPSHRP